MTHLIESGQDSSNNESDCFYISNRLFGGVNLVGCYNSGLKENQKLVNQVRRYFQGASAQNGVNDSFVSVVVDSGEVVSAIRYNLSNQTSKSDLKRI